MIIFYSVGFIHLLTRETVVKVAAFVGYARKSVGNRPRVNTFIPSVL